MDLVQILLRNLGRLGCCKPNTGVVLTNIAEQLLVRHDLSFRALEEKTDDSNISGAQVQITDWLWQLYGAVDTARLIRERLLTTPEPAGHRFQKQTYCTACVRRRRHTARRGHREAHGNCVCDDCL